MQLAKCCHLSRGANRHFQLPYCFRSRSSLEECSSYEEDEKRIDCIRFKGLYWIELAQFYDIIYRGGWTVDERADLEKKIRVVRIGLVVVISFFKFFF